MADNDNFDTLESAGTLGGTETVPIKSGFRNKKTTVDAIATYVAGAGKPLTGSFAGQLNGVTSTLFTPTVMTVSDNIGTTSFVQLNHATVKIAASIIPTEGRFFVISQKNAGDVAHTLTTAGTFDGTNNTATFNAADDALVLFAISSTRWIIIANIGSVALSQV